MQKQGYNTYRYLKDYSAGGINWKVIAVTASDISEEYSLQPLHVISNAPFVSILPKLTVPDLADSIAAMLARRSSGITTAPMSLMMRNYPTDPSSIVTAGEMLKQIQEDSKTELETVKAQITLRKVEAAKAAKAKAKEQEQFEKFKQQNQTG